MLEKTLESPLDCKEIQPVHSEKDQPWDFFGRNDAKAETPVLWPPHAKSWLIGKDSHAGRDWGQEGKGMTEDEMAGWHHWSVMSDSVWPHRRQPTRLCHPWDSPGKNTGVGCHFLLQCSKLKSESEVAQSCPTLCDPMDCSLPGSSVHGIFQARVLEWVATAFSEPSVWVSEKNNHWTWSRWSSV